MRQVAQPCTTRERAAGSRHHHEPTNQSVRIGPARTRQQARHAKKGNQQHSQELGHALDEQPRYGQKRTRKPFDKL